MTEVYFPILSLYSRMQEILWHGTRLKILNSILENGLAPNFARVRKGYLHLASDQGQAACYTNNMGEGEPLILSVRVEDLDISLLGPDREDLMDILEQNDDPRDWDEVDWKESLELTGQATYAGIIKPENLLVWSSGNLVPLKDFNPKNQNGEPCSPFPSFP